MLQGGPAGNVQAGLPVLLGIKQGGVCRGMGCFLVSGPSFCSDVRVSYRSHRRAAPMAFHLGLPGP